MYTDFQITPSHFIGHFAIHQTQLFVKNFSLKTFREQTYSEKSEDNGHAETVAERPMFDTAS